MASNIETLIREMIGICAFCARETILRESHVLPAFAYRWLRGRSGTGHMRHSDNPNRRVQDGLKQRWLCDDCEGLFSKDETAFATNAFYPWNDGTLHIQYQAWLLRFCVSVSWRVLKFARGRNKIHEYTKVQNTLMDRAEERWRAFLKGEIAHPGDFEQHLLIFDLIESTSIVDLPSNINRFMSGAITLDIVGSKKSLMTFAKLGNFLIFGMVQKGPDRWEGTKIHVRRGVLKPGNFVVPAGLLSLIREKAGLAEAALGRVSASQLAKIDESIHGNLDRFANSGQFKAIEADAELFGVQAILRKAAPTS
jgi:hypothetical protein